MPKATFWFPAKTRVEQYPEISHIRIKVIFRGTLLGQKRREVQATGVLGITMKAKILENCLVLPSLVVLPSNYTALSA